MTTTAKKSVEKPARAEMVKVKTDVLIIGGGLAGCMAAIKAAESGVEVTIAEKANTLSSGCAGTGIDHTWGYYPPVHQAIGWTLDDLVEDHTQGID
jgi:succinate dehydrogenase/fumarate reductase flavoprotein subunit